MTFRRPLKLHGNPPMLPSGLRIGPTSSGTLHGTGVVVEPYMVVHQFCWFSLLPLLMFFPHSSHTRDLLLACNNLKSAKSAPQVCNSSRKCLKHLSCVVEMLLKSYLGFELNPRPHISVAWGLGNIMDSLSQAADELNRLRGNASSTKKSIWAAIMLYFVQVYIDLKEQSSSRTYYIVVLILLSFWNPAAFWHYSLECDTFRYG
eukprot:Gb_21024 [translate_table: standard]